MKLRTPPLIPAYILYVAKFGINDKADNDYDDNEDDDNSDLWRLTWSSELRGLFHSERRCPPRSARVLRVMRGAGVTRSLGTQPGREGLERDDFQLAPDI